MIGSYRGQSAVALAGGSRLGAGVRVCAIDPHLIFKGIRGGEFGPVDQAELYRNLSQAGVGEHVAVVSLTSTAVAPT